jgi:hypothetical protein
MKISEFRKLIREEVRKVINEDDALDTQVRNVYRALVFSSDSNMNAAFEKAFKESTFKFSKDLVPTFLQAIVDVTKKTPEEVERIFSSADVEAVAKIDEKGLYNNGWFNNGVELLQKGIKRLK